MPRLARLDAPGVLHHVMGRGIERKNIFWNDKDRSDFIDRLAGVVEKARASISEPVPQLNNHHVSKYHAEPCLNSRSFHIVRLCHLDLTGQANQYCARRIGI